MEIINSSFLSPIPTIIETKKEEKGKKRYYPMEEQLWKMHFSPTMTEFWKWRLYQTQQYTPIRGVFCLLVTKSWQQTIIKTIMDAHLGWH